MDKKKLTLTEIKQLRKKCKHLMVDLGLDKRGSRKYLLKSIEVRLNKKINATSFDFAISGYRDTKRSILFLQELYEVLCEESRCL